MLIRKKSNNVMGEASRSQFYTDLEPQKKKPPPRPPPPKTAKSGVGWNQKLNDLWNHKSDDQWKPNSTSSGQSGWHQSSSSSVSTQQWAQKTSSDSGRGQHANTSSSGWVQQASASNSGWGQQTSSRSEWAGDAWAPKPSNRKSDHDWSHHFNNSWSQNETNGKQSVVAWGSAAPVPQPRKTTRDSGSQDLINWSSPHPSPSLSLHSDGTSIGSAGTDSQQTSASTSSGFDEDFDPFSPTCLEKNKRSSRILGPKVLPPSSIASKNKLMLRKSTPCEKPPVSAKPRGLASSTSGSMETYPISRPTVIKPKPRVKPDTRTSPTFGLPSNSSRSTPEPWNRGSPVSQSKRSPSPFSDPGNRWSSHSRPLSDAAQQWDSQSTHSNSSTSDVGGTRQWDSSRSVSPAPWSNLYSNQENVYNNQENVYNNKESVYNNQESLYNSIEDESPPMPCLPAPQLPSGVNFHEPSPPPLPPRPLGIDAKAKESQPHGIALYDYEASQQDDLGFKANDTITLVKAMNKDWMWGRIGRNEGMFPSNFIRVVVPLPGQKTATAIYAFQATHDDEISFPEGAIIEVLAKSGNEWLSGHYEDKEGLFPANFIDFVPENLPDLS